MSPTPARILVVDDDAAIRELVAEYLRGRGYDVTTAADGASACGAIASHPPAAVVTDLKLPDLDGIEVVRAAANCLPAVPVMVTTGYGTVEDTVAAFKAGACDFMLKPFRLRDLHGALETALERARADHESLFTSAALALLEQAALADEPGDAGPLAQMLTEVLTLMPGVTALALGSGEPLGATRAISVEPADKARPYVRAVHHALLRIGA